MIVSFYVTNIIQPMREYNHALEPRLTPLSHHLFPFNNLAMFSASKFSLYQLIGINGSIQINRKLSKADFFLSQPSLFNVIIHCILE